MWPQRKNYIKKQGKIRLQSEIAIKGTRRSHKGDKQQTGQAAKKTQREAKRPTADMVQVNAFTVEHNKWAKMENINNFKIYKLPDSGEARENFQNLGV